MKLQQQQLLIVGGSSGFGQAVAKQALAAGALVHIIGHSQSRVDQALAQLRSLGKIRGTALDAQDAGALQSFFSANGPFDHVLSFLGGAMGGGFLDNSVQAIRATIEAKFFANLQLVQLASRQLNNHGSIVLTSGSGGHPYDASGAIIGNQAIDTLVAGVAVELAPNYRINAVAPTWTPTGLWRQMTTQQRQQQAATVSAGIPLKRVATVNEVAAAYVYLMENDFVTGQVLHVDGGVDLV